MSCDHKERAVGEHPTLGGKTFPTIRAALGWQAYSWRMPTKGKIYEQIVEEAREWKADLIVLGSHGRTGAERLLLGSDAEQVARHTDVPVLLVRQKDADANGTT